jgi:hypothetical protein
MFGIDPWVTCLWARARDATHGQPENLPLQGTTRSNPIPRVNPGLRHPDLEELGMSPKFRK